MAKNKKPKKLSATELTFRKEQREQKKEIRDILKNIGFNRLNRWEEFHLRRPYI